MQHWQWIFGAIGLTLAWINLLLFVQKVLFVGIYVRMFIEIIKKLGKLFLVFTPFIIAFTFSFHLLLGNQIGFQNFPDAFLKTVDMLVGEIDLPGVSYIATLSGNLYNPSVKFGHRLSPTEAYTIRCPQFGNRLHRMNEK